MDRLVEISLVSHKIISYLSFRETIYFMRCCASYFYAVKYVNSHVNRAIFVAANMQHCKRGVAFLKFYHLHCNAFYIHAMCRKPLSNIGVQHLVKLNIITLDLTGCTKIDDNGLFYLSGVQYLQSLVLTRCNITDNGLLHLSGSQNLNWLYVSNCGITDEGLEHLCGLQNLSVLGLRGCKGISGIGLQHFKTDCKLSRLELQPSVTDDGLRHISNLSNLARLEIENNSRISDFGLSYISQLPKLKSLALHHNGQLTFTGLRSFNKPNSTLTYVSLPNISYSEEEQKIIESVPYFFVVS